MKLYTSLAVPLLAGSAIVQVCARPVTPERARHEVKEHVKDNYKDAKDDFGHHYPESHIKDEFEKWHGKHDPRSLHARDDIEQEAKDFVHDHPWDKWHGEDGHSHQQTRSLQPRDDSLEQQAKDFVNDHPWDQWHGDDGHSHQQTRSLQTRDDSLEQQAKDFVDGHPWDQWHGEDGHSHKQARSLQPRDDIEREAKDFVEDHPWDQWHGEDGHSHNQGRSLQPRDDSLEQQAKDFVKDHPWDQWHGEDGHSHSRARSLQPRDDSFEQQAKDFVDGHPWDEWHGEDGHSSKERRSLPTKRDSVREEIKEGVRDRMEHHDWPQEEDWDKWQGEDGKDHSSQPQNAGSDQKGPEESTEHHFWDKWQGEDGHHSKRQLIGETFTKIFAGQSADKGAAAQQKNEGKTTSPRQQLGNNKVTLPLLSPPQGDQQPAQKRQVNGVNQAIGVQTVQQLAAQLSEGSQRLGRRQDAIEHLNELLASPDKTFQSPSKRQLIALAANTVPVANHVAHNNNAVADGIGSVMGLDASSKSAPPAAPQAAPAPAGAPPAAGPAPPSDASGPAPAADAAAAGPEEAAAAPAPALGRRSGDKRMGFGKRQQMQPLVAIVGNNVPVGNHVLHDNNVVADLIGNTGGLDASSGPAAAPPSAPPAEPEAGAQPAGAADPNAAAAAAQSAQAVAQSQAQAIYAGAQEDEDDAPQGQAAPPAGPLQ